MAEVLTGGVGALLRAEARRGDALGLRAARGVDGVQGGLRALVKGTGRGLRRDKDPGDLASDLGRPLRSREGRGEGALMGGAARSVAGGDARGRVAGLLHDTGEREQASASWAEVERDALAGAW